MYTIHGIPNLIGMFVKALIEEVSSFTGVYCMDHGHLGTRRNVVEK